MMDWEDYEEKNLVRKASVDKALIRSLLKMCQDHLEFASKQVVYEKSSSVILVLYYEALREVCEALAALKGFKVYSHEAFTSFLKLKLGDEDASITFDRYRKLRNGVNYYGRAVDSEETVKASAEIPELIAKLKERHFKEFENDTSKLKP